MSMIMQDYLRQPGMESVIATAEQNLLWNKGALAVFDFGGIISGSATDAGNTPTTTLRGGLLLGKKTSDGKLYAWSASATDGTQNVYGILPFDVNLLDVNAAGQDRILGILIAGWLKNASILNLDAQARQQMRGRFWFDDDFAVPPGLYYPFKQQIPKTANYSVLVSDNGTIFTNAGAVGAVTFTLPAIADGLNYGFYVDADQSVTISSNEGSNVIAPGNASASNVAFTMPGRRIGGYVRIFSTPDLKWRLEDNSPQPLAIS